MILYRKTVLCCLFQLVACTDLEKTGSLWDTELSIEVQDLVLYVGKLDQSTPLIVRSKRSNSTDLPGRGRGQLSEVQFQFGSIRGTAKGATMHADGSLECENALIERGETQGLQLKAQTISLDSNGTIRGEGIHGRIKIFESDGTN